MIENPDLSRDFSRAVCILNLQVGQFPGQKRKQIDIEVMESSFDDLEAVLEGLGLSCCIEPERVARWHDPTGKWTARWWFSGRRQQFPIGAKADSKVAVIPHLLVDVVQTVYAKEWHEEVRNEISNHPHSISEATQ